MKTNIRLIVLAILIFTMVISFSTALIFNWLPGMYIFGLSGISSMGLFID